jgi:DNA-binding beta-propeller fold protein YncE
MNLQIQSPVWTQTIIRPLVLGEGKMSYHWQERWARLPDSESVRNDGRTHGIAVTANGRVIIFQQANPAVLILNTYGQLMHSWGDAFPGAHGLTLVQEGDEEFLWLTDTKTGAVVKTTLDGDTVLTLERPPLALYAHSKYSPTWVAVHEERFGGNGDIWVTDGYGSNSIYVYNKAGIYIDSINGVEGAAGLFKCPHAIFMDTRKLECELYIADRGNRRVQVYDVEGNFLRVFGEEILTSPCAFATAGDYLIIPELRGRVTVLDGQDRLVGYLGSNEAVCDIPGWPNHPSHLIQPGKFNSPHGVATDRYGNLYVSEWIIGGRVTKLWRVGAESLAWEE